MSYPKIIYFKIIILLKVNKKAAYILEILQEKSNMIAIKIILNKNH